MYNCLYGVSSEVLLTCFSDVVVSWICPYLCLLFSMCRAYADWVSLFFMYLMCSWYGRLKFRLVCPMCDL
jgi:hypothetical protein